MSYYETRQLTWGETLLVIWIMLIVTVAAGVGLRWAWIASTPGACVATEVES